jgi:catechol 2,3-dioxygenase-like lactoylglutathione lyase family enzyme
MHTTTVPTPTTTTGRATVTSGLVTGLNHAAILTADLDRLAAFYVEVFDGEILETPAPPGTRATTVRLAGAAGLAILEVPGNPHTSGAGAMLARGHLDHIAFDAPSPQALETIRRRLVDRGASDGTVHDYGPMLSVHFVDPDGMESEACWLRDPTFADAHAPEPFPGDLTDLAELAGRG